MTKNEVGHYPYSLVVWSDIKKSAKSSVAAAVALSIAWHHDFAEIFIIANDLKQADSRVATYFRRALKLNPFFKGNYRQRGYRTTFGHNGSYVEAIPIDPSGEAGSNADLIIFSELWGAHEDAKRGMWTEMTLSPTKFGESMRWVESYAGYTDESLLLYSLYEQGVLEGQRIWDDPEPTNFSGLQPIEAYESPGPTFTLWNTFPRLPFQTTEYYDSEHVAHRSDPDEFERMHRNQWMSSHSAFCPIEWWIACTDHDIPPMKKNEPIVLALDAAVTKDSFAVIGESRHPDNSEDTIVRYARKWLPPEGSYGIDFMGTEDNPGPEREVLRLIDEWNVVEIAYDTTQLEDMAGRMRRRGNVWMRPFDQQKRRLISDSALRDRIRDRHIHHSGEPDIEEHLRNADAKKDLQEERTIRIVKRSEGKKIDLAVGLSMCDYETMRLNL